MRTNNENPADFGHGSIKQEVKDALALLYYEAVKNQSDAEILAELHAAATELMRELGGSTNVD